MLNLVLCWWFGLLFFIFFVLSLIMVFDFILYWVVILDVWVVCDVFVFELILLFLLILYLIFFEWNENLVCFRIGIYKLVVIIRLVIIIRNNSMKYIFINNDFLFENLYIFDVILWFMYVILLVKILVVVNRGVE